MTAIVRHAKDRGEVLNVLGTNITILTSKATTSNLEVTHQSGNEGMGPPPHSHAWDETFYVLEGTVLFTCDGITELCEKGTLVHVPAGTVHAFQYAVGGGEMLEFTGQGSNAATMFKNVSDEVPPGPPDVEHVESVLNNNGVTVHL